MSWAWQCNCSQVITSDLCHHQNMSVGCPEQLAGHTFWATRSHGRSCDFPWVSGASESRLGTSRLGCTCAAWTGLALVVAGVCSGASSHDLQCDVGRKNTLYSNWSCIHAACWANVMDFVRIMLIYWEQFARIISCWEKGKTEVNPLAEAEHLHAGKNPPEHPSTKKQNAKQNKHQNNKIFYCSEALR